ncbi:MAG: redoxin domain-containing protein [Opitutales bacterium]
MKPVGTRLELDFVVTAVHHGEQRLAPFASLLTGPTLVSVYMKNNTGGCDRQIDALAAAAEEIRATGVHLIALSRDTGGSHLRYAARRGIDFLLVSDPEDRFASATGSLVEKKMYGRTFTGPSRSAYLLGIDGMLLACIEKVDTRRHGEEVVAMIGAAGLAGPTA